MSITRPKIKSSSSKPVITSARAPEPSWASAVSVWRSSPLGGDDATIGGMLATNAYGPAALRYGTLKDLIVGIELVRADGVIAHAGGKVVKNVAGFDISKLMVGSLGTLAIITKATFRVHPLPESTRRLVFNAKIDRVFPFVLALREAQLEPASISARINGDERDSRGCV